MYYKFDMDLSPELELRQINTQEISVYYKSYGILAFTISANPAHDAIGSPVPTFLTISGASQIMLTVDHRSASPAGGQFVYPVIGGAGWEGGFRTISGWLAEPEPENEEEVEEAEAGDEGARVGIKAATISAPVTVPHDAIPLTFREPSNVSTKERWFRAETCFFEQIWGDYMPGDYTKFRLSSNKWRCTGETIKQEGSLEGGFKPESATMVRGDFRYKRGLKVWIEHGPECFQWGKLQPHQIRCYASSQWSNDHIDFFGQFRFDPGHYLGMVAPMCVEMNPTVSPSPPLEGRGYVWQHYHLSRGPRAWKEECHWHNLKQLY
jgi:hypothetical protein